MILYLLSPDHRNMLQTWMLAHLSGVARRLEWSCAAVPIPVFTTYERRRHMSSKFTVSSVLADCNQVIAMWRATPDFHMNGLSLGELESLTRLIAQDTQDIADLGNRQIDLRLRRSTNLEKAYEYCTRARSAARGVFGRDAVQVKQSGGTRKSERKSRKTVKIIDAVSNAA